MAQEESLSRFLFKRALNMVHAAPGNPKFDAVWRGCNIQKSHAPEGAWLWLPDVYSALRTITQYLLDQEQVVLQQVRAADPF